MLDIIALAFSARVNIFQEFYCEYSPTTCSSGSTKGQGEGGTNANLYPYVVYADLFPLGLAVTTLTILFFMYVCVESTCVTSF